MLSKRLKAISDFIPEGSSVIDVGTDHGFLAIYLSKEKHCSVLATDKSSLCIIKAKENIRKYKAIVETKVTDGLKGLDITNKYIVIAGMGTKTILDIVSSNLDNDLIISSHRNLELLRKKMMEKGYYIYNEKAVFDKRYYVIMHFKKGRNKTNYLISPFLKDNKGYMQSLYDEYNKIYLKTPKSLKKIKVYFILKKIKKFC